MGVSSANFYMRDGRLFESVFYTRTGNQDFGLYTNDGTDIGRKFFNGGGSFLTGYQRKDGRDVGTLLFDNSYPVSGYLTSDNHSAKYYGYRDLDKSDPDKGDYVYYECYHNNVYNMVAHPTNGSGLYSYQWYVRGSDVGQAFSKYDKYKWGFWFRHSNYKSWTDAEMTTLLTKSTVHFVMSELAQYWYDPNVCVNGWSPVYIGCRISDTLTGNVYSPEICLEWTKG